MSPGAFTKWIAITFLCVAAHGQTTTTFEVASIKPATPLGPLGMRADRRGGPGTNDPGLYTCQNCPVEWVVSEAYDLQPWEYAGPDWLQHVRFDFAAKVPAGTTKEAFRTMLQNLLADRFRLAVHREKKEMAVYELTVARNGPKFRESAPRNAPDGNDGSNLRLDKDGFPILGRGTTMAVVSGHARIRSDDQPIAWFARMLSGQLQSPVTDGTKLQGKYDFIVSWSIAADGASGGSGGDSGAGSLRPADLYREALIGAVQSQLGLKIEKKKGQAEVLVIDHIDKSPIGN